jgi:hypothetical protein
VRTVAVLWVGQVVSEIGFGFALPFTSLYVQQLGVTDVNQIGRWAGFEGHAVFLTMTPRYVLAGGPLVRMPPARSAVPARE